MYIGSGDGAVLLAVPGLPRDFLCFPLVQIVVFGYFFNESNSEIISFDFTVSKIGFM